MKKRDAKAAEKNEKPKKESKREWNQRLVTIGEYSKFGVFNDPLFMYSGLFDKKHEQKELDFLYGSKLIKATHDQDVYKA